MRGNWSTKNFANPINQLQTSAICNKNLNKKLNLSSRRNNKARTCVILRFKKLLNLSKNIKLVLL